MPHPAYVAYPEWSRPDPGPFIVNRANGAAPMEVESLPDGYVQLATRWRGETTLHALTPAEARELGAALLESHDYINRGAMTTEDIRKETLARR